MAPYRIPKRAATSPPQPALPPPSMALAKRRERGSRSHASRLQLRQRAEARGAERPEEILRTCMPNVMSCRDICQDFRPVMSCHVATFANESATEDMNICHGSRTILGQGKCKHMLHAPPSFLSGSMGRVVGSSRLMVKGG